MRSFCVFTTGLLLSAGALAQPGTLSDSNNLDGIVVVVNNSIITKLQVNDPITDTAMRLAPMLRDDPTNYWTQVARLQHDQLEALEQSKLILDEFARGAYTTNWVDDAVNKMFKAELKKHFDNSETKLTLSLQTEGLTKEEYRRQMRERVIVDQLAHLHSTGKIIISPAAVEKYYTNHLDDFKVEDQVKLHTIYIAPGSDAPPGAAREIANEILHKMDQGVSFSDLAKEFSADAKSRAAGGDWGRWVDRKELIAPLREAAASLKPGQLSPIIEVPDERNRTTNCYIVRVDDVRPAHVSPLSEVQSAVEEHLKSERGNMLLEQWFRRLEAKSHIENF